MEAVSGKTFETFNPATEESLGHVAHGAAEDIELAVAAARRAFDDERSGWGREMGHNALDNYLETKSVVTQLA